MSWSRRNGPIGAYGDEDMTQEEIAHLLGVTQSAVGQVIRHAVRKLWRMQVVAGYRHRPGFVRGR